MGMRSRMQTLNCHTTFYLSGSSVGVISLPFSTYLDLSSLWILFQIYLTIFTAISLSVLGLCRITQIISLISFSILLTNVFDFGLIFCQLKTVIILKHKFNYNTPCLTVFQWLFIAFRILSKFSVSCESVSHSILCLALCNPMDCSLPGSSIHGIVQARILEWVAIPFSRGSSWPRDRTWVSCTAGRFFTIWATREAFSVS